MGGGAAGPAGIVACLAPPGTPRRLSAPREGRLPLRSRRSRVGSRLRPRVRPVGRRGVAKMAGLVDAGAALCSERFGSQAARGCSAAADGSLRWEAWGRRWCGGTKGAPGPAAPPLPRLLTVFLPQGFPDSVSPDYLPYQLWDSVQVSVAAAGGLGGSAPPLPPLRGLATGSAEL